MTSHSFSMDLWVTNVVDVIKNRATPNFYSSNGLDMESNGWIKISTRSFDFPLPDDIPGILRAGSIQEFEKQIRRIRAESERQITRIQGQINSLLAIENSAPAAPAPDDDIPF